MKPLARTAALATSALAVLAIGVGPAHAATTTQGRHADAHPVFVQNDAPSGNEIVQYDHTASGALQQTATYATGGTGGQLGGSVVDHLASQGSLTYDAGTHTLYAVNAGSNSITVFAVVGDRLVRRQVIGSDGSFPVSVAARDGRVFVLNARDGGSVQGYLSLGGYLLAIPSWHRGLGLNPAQTPEFTSTPGQIGFTPNGRQLLVSTKNGQNSVDVFNLGLFGPALKPVVNYLPGTVPFGFDFAPGGVLALTEAGPSAVATFTVAPSGRLTAGSSALTGQAATCWLTTIGSTAYASNAGSGNLSSYRVNRGGGLYSVGTTPVAAGTVDSAASSDGRYLYVQGGATGTVTTFGVGKRGALTNLGTVTVPDAVGAEGIAAL
ncbi:lactonase family protein [Leekyejoonella antrihumi]|uniref:Lactonase family protein n=1 Tax=Leekyejoonella antrihumi TaxID=1660198 RepID=A0A563DYB3_9MICO|nr:lactonase family protein [Leekyejoonella antrihumi]TWP34961.1 lactonase family protein [Leekyejoonella antrihumi]